jgi:hypothetical protein
MPYRHVRGAFPAWLLSWADASHADSHPGLHACAREFLGALLAAGGREPSPDYRRVEVHRNLDGADVVAVLDNGTVLLLLEELDGQGPIDRLDRLRARFADEYGPGNLCPICLELGVQSSDAWIRAAGFDLFGRRQLLDHARGWFEPGVRHAILVEYYDFLQSIENALHSWRTRPSHAWSDRSWQGFLLEVRARINAGGWGNTRGPAGEPWRLWWGWQNHPSEPITYLLTLESERLIFGLHQHRFDAEALVAARSAWLEAIADAARGSGLELVAPERPGWRRRQAVCRLPEYRSFGDDGCVDLEATLATIGAAQRVFEAACAVVGAEAGESESGNVR